MSGPEFFQTIMGRQFFDGTMPKLVKQLARIADALEHKARAQPAAAAGYRCSVCQGSNVQHAMWVMLNTNEVLDEYGTWNYDGSTYCNDCNDHTRIDSAEDDTDD